MATTARGRTAGARRPSVLVVDDERDICVLLEVNLGLRGVDVHCVHDGFAALDALSSTRVDLVVLDLMLPRMSGFDVLGRMRAEPALMATPVFALSAHPAELVREDALRAGATEFFAKPLSLERLCDAIAALVLAGRRTYSS